MSEEITKKHNYTPDQMRRIEELKKEYFRKADKIPEKEPPYNKLDSGAPGRYNELTEEFMKKYMEIVEG